MKVRKNSITLVTGTEHTRVALLEQLQEFIPEEMKISSYAIDEGLPEMIRDDLVIVSSGIVKKELEELERLDPASDILIAKRTINYEDVAKILRIPKGTEVLFVNDVRGTTLESIQVLKELGIDELIYIPLIIPATREVLPPIRRLPSHRESRRKLRTLLRKFIISAPGFLILPPLRGF